MRVAAEGIDYLRERRELLTSGVGCIDCKAEGDGGVRARLGGRHDGVGSLGSVRVLAEDRHEWDGLDFDRGAFDLVHGRHSGVTLESGVSGLPGVGDVPPDFCHADAREWRGVAWRHWVGFESRVSMLTCMCREDVPPDFCHADSRE